MGSLLLPIGTLASLIWMNILRENKIKVGNMERLYKHFLPRRASYNHCLFAISILLCTNGICMKHKRKLEAPALLIKNIQNVFSIYM
jgi:hypothetical protein